MPFVIDAEAFINVSLDDLRSYVDPAWRREVESGRPAQVLITDVGDPVAGGRIRPVGAGDPVRSTGRVVFADQLAGLGLHPLTELHVALAEAYARWLTEQFLPEHGACRGMLYLPAVDDVACLRIVRTYGGCRGVAGAYLTTNATLQPHDNRLVPVYEEMQQRDLVLAFQPTPSWPDPPFDTLDHYLAFWAVGTPFHQCFTAINWVLHGMPERFGRLRCLFCNAGLGWMNFLAHRMDREFLQRPSEAPLLRERPSHYLRRFFYTTYPLERVRDMRYLEATVRLLGSERWLYGSGFPHWDFDPPDAVESLVFLNSGERQAVLAGNAARVFGFGDGHGEAGR